MTAFVLVLSLFLQSLKQSSGVPGLSVAVAVHGRIVYADGAGLAEIENQVPATPKTVWNIGSVSKLITAVAVMQLVERGKVSLDDPIQKYVPEFPVKPEGTITIRHLLTHTSGIRHYKRGDFPGTPDNENTRPSTWLDGLKIFANEPLQFAPGTSAPAGSRSSSTSRRTSGGRPGWRRRRSTCRRASCRAARGAIASSTARR